MASAVLKSYLPVEDYLLADQDQPQVLLYRRRTDWAEERTEGLTSGFHLESVDLTLPMSQLYEDVTGIDTTLTGSAQAPLPARVRLIRDVGRDVFRLAYSCAIAARSSAWKIQPPACPPPLPSPAS